MARDFDDTFYARFADNCRGRGEQVRVALERFGAGQGSASDALSTLTSELHSLSGEASLLGLMRLGFVARQLKIGLQKLHRPLDPSAAQALEAIYSGLVEVAGLAAQQDKVTEAEEHLLVVEGRVATFFEAASTDG